MQVQNPTCRHLRAHHIALGHLSSITCHAHAPFSAATSWPGQHACLWRCPARPTHCPYQRSSSSQPRRGMKRLHMTCGALKVENSELLVGDVLLLCSFSCWKQIAAIVTSKDFPGWLAPLTFDPVRCAEFISFAVTLVGVWVSSMALVGGYQVFSTRDVPTSLRVTSLAWLVSMPVAAAQLVLVTALNSRTLVGDDAFTSGLPLAASGYGEPFSTASGVLGLMIGWRAFYAVYLDNWGSTTATDAARFREAIMMVALMGMLSLVVLQGLRVLLVPPVVDILEEMDSALALTATAHPPLIL